MRSGVVALALAMIVASGGACGPVTYVRQVTRRASAEVEAARAVRAERYAPYWYTLAVEYLVQARREAARADYEAANRYGRKASEAAQKARAEALEVAADPDAASDVAPAEGGRSAPLDERPR